MAAADTVCPDPNLSLKAPSLSADILMRVVAQNLSPELTLVEKVMTPNPECATLETTILDALHIMHDGKFLHLPVLDKSEGMSARHLLACPILATANSIIALRPPMLAPNRLWAACQAWHCTVHCPCVLPRQQARRCYPWYHATTCLLGCEALHVYIGQARAMGGTNATRTGQCP
ncbi:hypothetical protein TorRG33x02_314500 [Trema orientale]|uniref:CBS domain-containing protein n=1 Tax=Trema orientale TaxID=63057 RepID=A0A2P5BNN6_TREOI|nr:hypothetical protein TorRG33x02_314500 [Trema orientale]